MREICNGDYLPKSMEQMWRQVIVVGSSFAFGDIYHISLSSVHGLKSRTRITEDLTHKRKMKVQSHSKSSIVSVDH